MKYVLTSICLFLLIILECKSQTDRDNIVPPSPNTAALFKFNEIPVSTYTGTPNISIPIYEVKEKDIILPITLNYHASGIRVNEEAGHVGLGWSLNVPAMITRTVRGRDDFDGGYFRNNLPELDALPVAWRNNDCNVELVNGETFSTCAGTDCGDIVDDYEPDLYRYNFPGYAGSFVLKRDKTVVLKEQGKIAFEMVGNGHAWIVRTPNGFTYHFTLTESHQHNNTRNWNIIGWYLTKIESPQNHNIIFNYSQSSFEYTDQVGSVHEQRYVNISPQEDEIGYQLGTRTSDTYLTSRLTSIEFSMGKIEFSYSQERVDLTGGYQLDTISIYDKKRSGGYNVTPLKVFEFAYGYFIGNRDNDLEPGAIGEGNTTNTPYLTHRRKLTSVKEIGNEVEKPPYRFFYNEPASAPCKASFARDHWGYFNGVYSNTTLLPDFVGQIPYEGYTIEWKGADREANKDHVNLFNLIEIEYPTGGKTIFEYESHTYQVETQDNTEVGNSERVSKSFMIRSEDGLQHGVLDLTDMVEVFNVTQGFGGPVDMTVTFRCTSQCEGVDDSGLLAEGDIFFTLPDGREAEFFNMNDGACRYEPGSACFRDYSFWLKPEVYFWKGQSPVVNGVYVIDIIVTVSYRRQKGKGFQVKEKFAYGGGVRVKKIHELDGLNDQPFNVRTFDYHHFKNGNNTSQELSHGRLMSTPKYSGLTYFYIFPHHARSFVLEADSRIPLGRSAQGNLVGYDQVTVTYGEKGRNGKSISYYHNQIDGLLNYEFWSSTGIPSISFNRNGLLLKKKDYVFQNGQYLLKEEVLNKYREQSDFRNAAQNDIVFGVRRMPVPNVNYVCHNISFIYPALWSEWIYLEKQTRKHYDIYNSGPVLVSEEIYEYNKDHFQPVKVTTSRSDGRLIENYILYTEDYSDNTGFINGLREAHIHNVPVEQVSISINNNGAREITTGIVNVFNQFGQPELIYQLESIGKIPLTQFKFSNVTLGQLPGTGVQTGFSFDPAYEINEKRVYDSDGYLEEIEYPVTFSTSYQWDTFYKVPQVRVVGATAGEIYYTGFEDSGYSGNSFAGGHSLNSGTFTIPPQDRPVGDDLVMTYWYFKGGEWRFQPETSYSPNITVSGADHLDELIVYPKGTEPYILSYEPLLGVISETDANGKITRYRYDGLSRLKMIVDHKNYPTRAINYKYHSN